MPESDHHLKTESPDSIPRHLRTKLTEAADVFGTPTFVMDASAVDVAALEIESGFPPPWLLHYSLKANDLPAIVQRVARREREWGANVVSVGEWEQATAAEVGNARVTFEGLGKTDEQLARAVEAAAQGRGVRWVAVESLDELTVLASLAREAHLGRDGRSAVDILLRLNPEVVPETVAALSVGSSGSKFGMPCSEITGAAAYAERAAPGLRLRGIHVHIGSQLTAAGAWVEAGERAVRLWSRLRVGRDACDTVDFGGGFPLPGSFGPDPSQFVSALGVALAAAGLELPPRCAVEPGRYLVGKAGWLLTRVLHVREKRGPRSGIVLDAGMTELIRPALYGARHPISVLAAQGGRGVMRSTAVDGPICEATDSFGDYRLPPLVRGDLLAIGDAGGYGSSFTSRYNGRPAPKDVLLLPDGRFEVMQRAPL